MVTGLHVRPPSLVSHARSVWTMTAPTRLPNMATSIVPPPPTASVLSTDRTQRQIRPPSREIVMPLYIPPAKIVPAGVIVRALIPSSRLSAVRACQRRPPSADRYRRTGTGCSPGGHEQPSTTPAVDAATIAGPKLCLHGSGRCRQRPAEVAGPASREVRTPKLRRLST